MNGLGLSGLGPELEARLESGKPVDADDLADRFAVAPQEVLDYQAALEALAWGAPPAEPMPKSLKGYELRGELGRGGSGVVWLGWDPAGQREVVIKILRTDRLDEVSRARFLREARALTRLDHPNVVRVLEVGSHDGRPLLVFERVPGRTLREQLQRGPLPPRRAAELICSLALAIQHAHDRGVLHRDLKPSNVIVTPAGEPLLVDFGLVLDQQAPDQALSVSGHFLGTPGYWSPEQATGKRSALGPASDVYGLGATLYACLTGVSPTISRARTQLEVVAAAARHIPQAPSSLLAGVPPELDSICLRCLEKEPDGRYASAQELADALTWWLQGGPETRRGNRRLVVVALVSAGILGGLAGWATLPRAASTPTRALAQVDAALEGGDPEGAGKRLLALLEQDPQNEQVLIRLGKIALDRGSLAEALAYLDRAVEAAPASGLSRRNRAVALVRLGDLQGAEVDLRESVRLEPDDVTTRVFLVRILADLRDYPELRVQCDQGLVLDPSVADFWTLRAIARGRQDDWEGAVADATRALELSPDDAEALRERGASLTFQGQFEAALEDLNRLVELIPQDLPASWARASTLAEMRRFSEAEAEVSRALSLGERPAWSYALRAKLRLEQGDLPGAWGDCRLALELDPRITPARELLQKLRAHALAMGDGARVAEADALLAR